MEALQFEGTMAVLGAENLGTKMSVADDPSKPTSIFENSEGGRRTTTTATDVIWGRQAAAASGNAGIFYPRGFRGSGGGREGERGTSLTFAGCVPKASIVVCMGPST